MAINLNTRYPDNSDVDSEYLVGKARNESFDGAKDYFPLEATWVNELLGFFSALLHNASLTPDGNPETKSASQYFDAINGLDISISRLADGNKTQLIGQLAFGDPAQTFGYATLVGVAGYGGYVSSSATSLKSYSATCRLFNGGHRYSSNTGNTHAMTSILRPISSTIISNQSNTYDRWLLIDAFIFTGVNYGLVYRCDLIMKNSSNILVAPVIGDFYNSSGTLALGEGYCSHHALGDYPIGSYTEFYLRIDIDPVFIS
jgi:hypothetical protein